MKSAPSAEIVTGKQVQIRAFGNLLNSRLAEFEMKSSDDTLNDSAMLNDSTLPYSEQSPRKSNGTVADQNGVETNQDTVEFERTEVKQNGDCAREDNAIVASVKELKSEFEGAKTVSANLRRQRGQSFVDVGGAKEKNLTPGSVAVGSTDTDLNGNTIAWTNIELTLLKLLLPTLSKNICELSKCFPFKTCVQVFEKLREVDMVEEPQQEEELNTDGEESQNGYEAMDTDSSSSQSSDVKGMNDENRDFGVVLSDGPAAPFRDSKLGRQPSVLRQMEKASTVSIL